MQSTCFLISKAHLPSSPPFSRKQASRADFVSGQAQHLLARKQLKSVGTANTTAYAHGLRPCGLSGFIIGFVGSYFSLDADAGDGDHQDEIY